MERQEIIRRIMDFPLDKVLYRYRKEKGLSAHEAREHERELKRFLALVAINNRGYGMRGPIDGLWHTFILFTHIYERFCREAAGRFIHHFPNIAGYLRERGGCPDADRTLQLGSKQYQQFLDDYAQTYHEPTPAHLWPRPTAGTASVYAAVECQSDDCGNDPDGPDGGGTGGD